MKTKDKAPETRTTTRPAWMQEMTRAIAEGRLLVEADHLLTALTPDIATADGALMALWVHNGARQAFPGYLNMFQGSWHVYRNGRRIWIAQTRDRDRLHRLFARALGIDYRNEQPETLTREVKARGPRRIPALVDKLEGRAAA